MATARRGSDRIAEIRRTGRRVQSGPWVLVLAPAVGPDGRLIAALGRKAGPAVTRSRVRRVVRECYGARRARLRGDILLMARANVSQVTRAQIRADLHHLFGRLEPTGTTHG